MSTDPRIVALRRRARLAGWTVFSVSASSRPPRRAKIDLVAARKIGRHPVRGTDIYERVEVNVDTFNSTIYAVQRHGSQYVRDVRGEAAVEALLDAPIPEVAR